MDFYVILGLSRDASLMDVKRAYRRLARRFHPDINPGDQLAAVKFREIAEAYDTLSDPDRRRRYDLLGHQPEPQPAAVGFEGFDFSAGVHAVQQGTFGDLFADVFARERPPAAGRERGADLHLTLTFSLEDAVRGGEWPLALTRQGRCGVCAGSGMLEGAESRCAHCQGSGQLRSARGHMVFSRACPRCHGRGSLRAIRCTPCSGTGLHMRSETLMVRVPAGVADGARIRIAEHGHAGARGGAFGDLYVTVHVVPHARFRREGDDLHVVLPLAIHEAALGARVELPMLDGAVRVRVPPGTQSGQRFRLRGRGVPSPRDGRRGDLVIEARLMLPKLLDERSKQLLREFGEINRESVREQ